MIGDANKEVGPAVPVNSPAVMRIKIKVNKVSQIRKWHHGGVKKMKSVFDIIVDQVRSREIWKRVWELNRLKKFENYQEYKKRVSRRITKEDIPALIVTVIILTILITLLNLLFTGTNLTHAVFGLMAVLVITQKVIEYIRTKRNGNEEIR